MFRGRLQCVIRQGGLSISAKKDLHPTPAMSVTVLSTFGSWNLPVSQEYAPFILAQSKTSDHS